MGKFFSFFLAFLASTILTGGTMFFVEPGFWWGFGLACFGLISSGIAGRAIYRNRRQLSHTLEGVKPLNKLLVRSPRWNNYLAVRNADENKIARDKDTAEKMAEFSQFYNAIMSIIPDSSDFGGLQDWIKNEAGHMHALFEQLIECGREVEALKAQLPKGGAGPARAKQATGRMLSNIEERQVELTNQVRDSINMVVEAIERLDTTKWKRTLADAQTAHKELMAFVESIGQPVRLGPENNVFPASEPARLTDGSTDDTGPIPLVRKRG